MTTVIIVVHLMVVLAMIGLVLLQRSEGGALGIGGGQGAFMTGRGAGNVLTRATGVLALAFFATSLALALIAKYESRPSDILERLPADQSAPTGTEGSAPLTGTPTTAEDILKEFGTTQGGPQTPPAASGEEQPASGTGGAAAPSPAPAPATGETAPALPPAPAPAQ